MHSGVLLILYVWPSKRDEEIYSHGKTYSKEATTSSQLCVEYVFNILGTSFYLNKMKPWETACKSLMKRASIFF